LAYRTISGSYSTARRYNRPVHWAGLMLDRSAVGQLSSLPSRTKWQLLLAGNTLRSYCLPTIVGCVKRPLAPPAPGGLVSGGWDPKVGSPAFLCLDRSRPPANIAACNFLTRNCLIPISTQLNFNRVGLYRLNSASALGLTARQPSASVCVVS